MQFKILTSFKNMFKFDLFAKRIDFKRVLIELIELKELEFSKQA